MDIPLNIINTISIKTSPEKLWDVLTNPAITKLYMFGCETVSDWKKGSELLWKGSYEGKEMVFVKGKIEEINPPSKLVYSVFDPNSTMPDIPQNYLHVTYELTKEADQVLFKVTQGDYSKVAEGEKRYAESSNNGEGWNPILKEIKKVAEGN